MGRLIRYLIYLAVLAVLGLAGYALLGDLSPDQRQITVPVEADGS